MALTLVFFLPIMMGWCRWKCMMTRISFSAGCKRVRVRVRVRG